MNDPKSNSLYHLDLHSRGYDTLYREGLDGYIGIGVNQLTADDEDCKLLDKYEMLTIIDLTTLWQTKQAMAAGLANDL